MSIHAKTPFEPQDQAQLAALGISEAKVEAQLELFRKGIPFSALSRACTLDDGLILLDEDTIPELMTRFEAACKAGRVTKFVPASGAATRMFKSLHSAREKLQRGESFEDQELDRFLESLTRFAFYEELAALLGQRQQKTSDVLAVLDALLGSDGMDYGSKPKGLLTFHRYADKVRTPLEEHLEEARQYGADQQGRAHLHFTVSPEHLDSFQAHLEKARAAFESLGLKAEIGFSVQKESTNTLAVTPENEPFRDNQGRLLFRPAGHGALIENLADLKADLVFIKNIDNIVPDHLKGETTTYKKALGGLLLRIQDKVFAYLRQLDETVPDNALSEEILSFASANLGTRLPPGTLARDQEVRRSQLRSLLNRPLRVCGMVRNQGEPGGGPFWIRDEKGLESIQIVESSQIDLGNPQQSKILATASHFNPVDLVCGVRDYRGEPFALTEFVDPNACFLSEKSYEGRPLKALELPGLWNGAMANWNTCFVEVPLATFNPVKTVNDLLRAEHQV